MSASTDVDPTAAIVTIGEEIVGGRVLNENATWLSDELMARGVWAAGGGRGSRREPPDRQGAPHRR